jgi:transcriptional regulator with XRE-family HTH domain
MVARNKLQAAPPHPVEQGLKALGANLRAARIRRRMTIGEAAQRIGTGPRAVMDAERGKPSTGIVVYAALLWLYGLMAPLADLADPAHDREGLVREAARRPRRARRGRGLDNDF